MADTHHAQGPGKSVLGIGQRIVSIMVEMVETRLRLAVVELEEEKANLFQLLLMLGLNSEEQKEDTNYLDGIQGLLKTKDGQQLNLDNIGTTPLAEKVKTKACDLVLKQGLNFIS